MVLTEEQQAIVDMARAFAEGVERAVAGEPGMAQDHGRASYAAPFTEAEHWLDWAEPAATLRRKVAALNLFGGAQALARIDGAPYSIARLEPWPEAASTMPGTVLERAEGEVVIGAGDGAVRVVTRPMATEQEG